MRNFVVEDVKIESQYFKVHGKFKAEKFRGADLMDTNVDLILKFCLSWESRNLFIKELAKLLEKYSI